METQTMTTSLLDEQFEEWLDESGNGHLLKTVYFGYEAEPSKIKEALKEAFQAGATLD
jgi:hypothetical protein